MDGDIIVQNNQNATAAFHAEGQCIILMIAYLRDFLSYYEHNSVIFPIPYHSEQWCRKYLRRRARYKLQRHYMLEVIYQLSTNVYYATE
ncbi:hypothetical protein e1004f01.tmp0161 [Eimeria tenella]|uniref:Uncharacterized protein n=1 Tax=Eimeria tenella TaxID=5802 RepID=C8TE30_EIMTE|nr:hypothetical protein e1004f01.tmp0161 [Eimeria tenella]